MYSSQKTKPSTAPCSAELDALRTALREADAVLIGAGAGLSAAAGFTYSGARFEQYFSDLREKYGFSDMYSGGFYPYPTEEEFWGYWSRYIYVNRYLDPPTPLYEQLLALVARKDYFVLTTNVDHCFQKAGFDKTRLFYTQGDFGLFQCSAPCCNETFDNEAAIREMVAAQRGGKVPTALLPRCPHCGRPLTTNLRADNKFVEDWGWLAAAQRYADYLREHQSGKLLLLELGVGYNTPGIIKYPFWRMTAANPQATYACLNLGPIEVPHPIEPQTIRLQADLAATLAALGQ